MSDEWSPTTLVLLAVSALAAGVVNALAGGGTLLTFPSLVTALRATMGVAADVATVLANGTSTVALLPGSLAGAWGYRRELRAVGRWPLLMIPPSLIGGWIGTKLVTQMDEKYFAAAVPWLILTATLLFLLQPMLVKWSLRLRPGGMPDPSRLSVGAFAALIGAQFLIAIYGGYFGAGIGILMLSALGLMGLGNIHEMNAVKTVLAACMNAMSVIVFIQDDKVVWVPALVMAGAAIVGGFLGAHYGRRLPRAAVRWLVIAIGFGLAVKYFVEQFTA